MESGLSSIIRGRPLAKRDTKQLCKPHALCSAPAATFCRHVTRHVCCGQGPVQQEVYSRKHETDLIHEDGMSYNPRTYGCSDSQRFHIKTQQVHILMALLCCDLISAKATYAVLKSVCQCWLPRITNIIFTSQSIGHNALGTKRRPGRQISSSCPPSVPFR